MYLSPIQAPALCSVNPISHILNPPNILSAQAECLYAGRKRHRRVERAALAYQGFTKQCRPLAALYRQLAMEGRETEARSATKRLVKMAIS